MTRRARFSQHRRPMRSNTQHQIHNHRVRLHAASQCSLGSLLRPMGLAVVRRYAPDGNPDSTEPGCHSLASSRSEARKRRGILRCCIDPHARLGNCGCAGIRFICAELLNPHLDSGVAPTAVPASFDSACVCPKQLRRPAALTAST